MNGEDSVYCEDGGYVVIRRGSGSHSLMLFSASWSVDSCALDISCRSVRGTIFLCDCSLENISKNE